MNDVDYSPAINEEGTEFDIIKAAEIAREALDIGDPPQQVIDAYNAGLRDAPDAGLRDHEWCVPHDHVEPAPAPAGLDVEALAPLIRDALAAASVAHHRSREPLSRHIAKYVIDNLLRAATRPADNPSLSENAKRASEELYQHRIAAEDDINEY